MFCPNCGTNIADGSAFCTNCGTKIASLQAAAPQTAPAPGAYERTKADKLFEESEGGMRRAVNDLILLATNVLALFFIVKGYVEIAPFTWVIGIAAIVYAAYVVYLTQHESKCVSRHRKILFLVTGVATFFIVEPYWRMVAPIGEVFDIAIEAGFRPSLGEYFWMLILIVIVVGDIIDIVNSFRRFAGFDAYCERHGITVV